MMLPAGNLPGVLDLLPVELEALTRLGPDGFDSWAVKGWASPEVPNGTA